MDISKPINYRGLAINTASLETGRVLRGITVETVDYSDIETVGYTEKRAAADGMHASDVYLGARMVTMSGFVYAPDLAEMFDFLHVLRSVFSPTSAYLDDPGNRGFLPMTFQQPTKDVTSFPGGIVPLQMLLRPQSPVRFNINRDRQTNGKPTRPTATQWAVRLFAKDPRVYVYPEQSVDIAGAPITTPVHGNAINRGDYETPLNIMLVIGATVPAALAAFRVKGFNNIDMTIKVEAKANVIYRWFGDDRVLMTEDISAGVGTAPLVLRMDLVTWATKQHRAMVPAAINPPSRPFTTGYDYWRTSLTLAAGSRLFWSEAFA